MKLEKTFHIQAEPEKVMKAIQDPKFIELDEKARKTQAVEIKDVKKDKTQHVYEIKTVTYARGATGIDKTKTQTNVNTTTWDLRKMVGSWTYVDGSEFSNKLHIQGGYKIGPQGRGTDLTMWVEINIDIPFLGGQIAKKVGGGFEREWPNYADRILRWINK